LEFFLDFLDNPFPEGYIYYAEVDNKTSTTSKLPTEKPIEKNKIISKIKEKKT
jgi:hypothetical protein